MVINDVFNELSKRMDRHWNPPSWRNMLVTFPWVIGLIFFLYGAIADHSIASRERTAYGIIRTHEPENHDRFGYEFSLNGKVYTGWQIPTTEYEIGQRVLVYYDPRDPTTSSLYSFAGGADQDIGPALFCAAGMVLFTGIIFSMRRTHSRRL